MEEAGRVDRAMRKVACPQCGTEVVWEESATRPFCSERCRLMDLGAWLDEKYVIPGEAVSLPDDDGEDAS